MTNALIIAGLIALAAWAIAHTVKKAQKGGGCCGEHDQAPAKVQAADHNRRHYPYEITLRIGGMTCDNCARRVENALNGLDGVWARVRVDDHQAYVRCKQPPDVDALSEAVRQAGYVVLRNA